MMKIWYTTTLEERQPQFTTFLREFFNFWDVTRKTVEIENLSNYACLKFITLSQTHYATKMEYYC